MNFVGHVFNVPISGDFEHVENVLHENITASERCAGLTNDGPRGKHKRLSDHQSTSEDRSGSIRGLIPDISQSAGEGRYFFGRSQVSPRL